MKTHLEISTYDLQKALIEYFKPKLPEGTTLGVVVIQSYNKPLISIDCEFNNGFVDTFGTEIHHRTTE
jgi:hypothetical protein